jgi:hypothetical protein
MRRRRLKKLIKRLRQLQQQNLTRDELLLKLGAAKKVGQGLCAAAGHPHADEGSAGHIRNIPLRTGPEEIAEGPATRRQLVAPPAADPASGS